MILTLQSFEKSNFIMIFNKDVHLGDEINCEGKTGSFLSDYGLNGEDFIKGFILSTRIDNIHEAKVRKIFLEIDWDILYFCDNGRKVSSCALPKEVF